MSQPALPSSIRLSDLLAYLQQPLVNTQEDIKDNSLPVLPTLDVHCFDAVSSTNHVVWDLLSQGAGEGTVAIAQRQAAGKGQWGRSWASSPGGLYLSLALCPNLQTEQGRQLMLSSAWGVAVALRNYCLPVLLKWPNDLVIGRQKLGGMLLETRVRGDRITQAVLGIGINWSNEVPETGVTIRDWYDQGDSPQVSEVGPLSYGQSRLIQSLEMLAAIVLQGVMLGYRRWHQEGMSTILNAYNALLSHQGQQVAVGRPEQGVRYGQVVGVTPAGNLRVRLTTPHPSHLDSPGHEQDVIFKPGEISLGYG